MIQVGDSKSKIAGLTGNGSSFLAEELLTAEAKEGSERNATVGSCLLDRLVLLSLAWHGSSFLTKVLDAERSEALLLTL